MLNDGNQFQKELQSDVLTILAPKISTREKVGRNIEDKENSNVK